MLRFKTHGFNGYSVKYSPFFNNKIIVGTGANYGLIGNGRVFVLGISDEGYIYLDCHFDTQDAVFDSCWSEIHENHVVAATGDGSVKLFDIKVSRFPLNVFKEHTREVFSVNWNMINKSLFCTSSWDSTIKIWSPEKSQSLLTLETPPQKNDIIYTHIDRVSNTQLASQECIYSAKFSPHSDSILASANSISEIKIWDIRAPLPLQSSFRIETNNLKTSPEVLSLDWNKYRPTLLASGSVDCSIHIHDIRMIKHNTCLPQTIITHHKLPVRSVSWSPHHSDLVLSTSYDMTACVSSDCSSNCLRGISGGQQIKVMNDHIEFVMDGDWSLWGEPGWVATVGWDQMVYIWNV